MLFSLAPRYFLFFHCRHLSAESIIREIEIVMVVIILDILFKLLLKIILEAMVGILVRGKTDQYVKRRR